MGGLCECLQTPPPLGNGCSQSCAALRKRTLLSQGLHLACWPELWTFSYYILRGSKEDANLDQKPESMIISSICLGSKAPDTFYWSPRCIWLGAVSENADCAAHRGQAQRGNTHMQPKLLASLAPCPSPKGAGGSSLI